MACCGNPGDQVAADGREVKATPQAASKTPGKLAKTEKPLGEKVSYHYFDGYGRGEPARVLLSMSKIQFEDVRLQ